MSAVDGSENNCAFISLGYQLVYSALAAKPELAVRLCEFIAGRVLTSTVDNSPERKAANQLGSFLDVSIARAGFTADDSLHFARQCFDKMRSNRWLNFVTVMTTKRFCVDLLRLKWNDALPDGGTIGEAISDFTRNGGDAAVHATSPEEAGYVSVSVSDELITTRSPQRD